MEDGNEHNGKPFKITDFTREHRKGVVATSLEDLTLKIREKLGIHGDVIIVLEGDGTEIDDDEYFATLDPHTNLMVLAENQKWQPPAPPCRLSVDQIDDGKGGGPELELLSDMDPDSLVDITFPDKIFLEQLKEASGRYLSEKRQAQDALELLRLYQEKETESGGTQ
ncbi:CIDE-N domain [Popillia japonica]|uniref:CIDE-N domain n=1 Tax=Popillia japonica TaxID=7064 RepID=A0AAW1LBN7_POPJA